MRNEEPVIIGGGPRLVARTWWQRRFAPAHIQILAERAETGMLQSLFAQSDRWFLWVPVLFGIGIGIYFAARTEPAASTAILLAIAGLVVWSLIRVSRIAMLVAAIAACVGVGFAAAKFRTLTVAAPILAYELRNVTVTGFVDQISPRPDRGPRLALQVTDIDGLARSDQPKRIRVRLLRPLGEPLAVGTHVSLRATLSPPPRPAQPGDYDFARAAFFSQLGAIGFSTAQPMPVAVPSDRRRPIVLAVWARLEAFRAAISTRIRNALPGEAGLVASALITGERGAISPETQSAFRDAGLAHVLVISGLHMMIVTATLFFLVRFVLALWPGLASRLATKKWAAVAAAVCATAYLLISGGAVATVRAYIMLIVMLIAVLLDRPAIALRNVAIAALLILAFKPESLLDIGFQMSFAAVVALVATYEVVRDWRRQRAPDVRRGVIVQPVIVAFGIAFTTLVASAAIAPIAAFHFHLSQQYGVLANLLAVPIFNFAIMPLAILSAFAMTIGLETYPLMLMGWFIDAASSVAYAVAGLGGAVIAIPAFPWQAFALMIFGMLWLAIWRGRLRLWGLAVLALGVAITPMLERPDVLVAGDGRLVAVRSSDKRLEIVGRGGRFELGRWLAFEGDRRRPQDLSAIARRRCDRHGCIIEVKGMVLALSRRASGLSDDCAHAEILIAQSTVQNCSQPRIVIDRAAIANSGGHALFISRRGDPGRASANGPTRGWWSWQFWFAPSKPDQKPEPDQKSEPDLKPEAEPEIDRGPAVSSRSARAAAISAPAPHVTASPGHTIWPTTHAHPGVMSGPYGTHPQSTAFRVRVVTVDQVRGRRPWVLTPEQRALARQRYWTRRRLGTEARSRAEEARKSGRKVRKSRLGEAGSRNSAGHAGGVSHHPRHRQRRGSATPWDAFDRRQESFDAPQL